MNQPSQPFRTHRVVRSPRATVWRAYTEQEPLMAWFGPRGFSMPVCHYDFRPGGTFHYCLRTPTGLEMWGKWEFVDIVAPERLVMVVSFSDAQGGLTRHPLSNGWPLRTLSDTRFSDLGDGSTRIDITWSAPDASPEEVAVFNAGFASMAQGCNGTFDQLEAYLAQNPNA
ncbi:MAG: SRPBCC domain-containing protein [Rhodoferax sp.]